MKIAVLAPIRLDNPGGVEAHVLQLTRATRKLGADVDVFGKTAGDGFSAFKNLSSDKYDVIHTHGSIFSPRFIPLAIRLLDSQRHVHTLHGVTIDYLLACRAWLNWRCYTSTFIEGLCSRTANHVIAVSESVAGRARQCFLLAEDKITVIPNGFTPAPLPSARMREQSRQQFGLASEHLALLFVGRGEDPVKGTDAIARALNTLYPRHPNLRLLAAPGDGFSNAPWLYRTKSLPLSDMPRYYAAGDVYINASLNEGMPLTIIEALASGLPVIASPVGGIPELITSGSNGLLLKPDRSDLADRIEQVVQDASLRRRLALNAPSSVARLTWDAIAQKTLDVYQNLFR